MSDKIPVTIHIDQELYDALTKRAKADDRSRAAVVRVALRAYLATDEDDQ